MIGMSGGTPKNQDHLRKNIIPNNSAMLRNKDKMYQIQKQFDIFDFTTKQKFEVPNMTRVFWN